MKLTQRTSSYKLPATGILTVRANTATLIDASDVPAQVQQAFANPLDYPSLASATVPGDTVAIALEHGTPHVLQVVAGVLSAVEQAGIESTTVTILLAPEFSKDKESQQALRELAGEKVSVEVHRGDDEAHLALLGVSEAGEALRLNRVLCDADIVIPIGPTRGGEGDLHPAGMLFPRFSDEETLGRFNAANSHEAVAARRKLNKEIEKCDWLLGVGLALQVVPGPGGAIAGLYCGTTVGSAAAARERYAEVWSAEVRGRADLIIATIAGNDAEQTWHNLGRALANADELLEPDGAIAIYTKIATRPGPSGRRLIDSRDLAAVERQLITDKHPDSAAALLLCRFLQRGTIYLKSELEPTLVESLGLAPISSDQEIERLAKAYHRCIVLEEAQRLKPKLVGEGVT